MNAILRNFSQCVPAKIWQRGMDYYMDGTVTDLEETSPGEWTVTVEGTDIYTVEISLDGDNVESWYCDCPYDGGDICKHVVAAILAICDEQKKATKSAFSEMKLKAEDAEIVGGTSQDDDFANLMRIAKEEDIRSFVIDYASKHREVKAALSNYLQKKYIQPSAIEKDYKKEVEDIFQPTHSRRSRYSRYNDDFELLNWEAVGIKMNKLLEKAQLLLKVGNIDATLCIALQFFRSLDDNYDESLMYNECEEIYECCEKSAELILDGVGHSSLSMDRKMEILQEVRRLAKCATYRSCDMYDMEELLIKLNLIVQSPQDALKLLDNILKEQHSSYDQYRYVSQKVDILREINRDAEADETVRHYLYLPEIRQKEVEKLQRKQRYAEALQLLDEGITIAKENGHSGTENQWLRAKLDIFELQGDTASAISVCRQLFIWERGRMEYYHKLKGLVSSCEWKAFWEEMLTHVDHTLLYGSSIVGDIYVEEKEYDKLFHLISVTASSDRLKAIMNYAYQLPESYASSLLSFFAIDLRVFAEVNMGRNYYVEVAQMLNDMKKLKGGKEVVKALVEEFRIKYKRRPALIDELKRV